MTDRVLLYVLPGAAAATFLEELDPTAAVPMLAGENQLIFAGDTAATSAGRTNLQATRVNANGATPTTPVTVATGFADPGGDGLTCQLLSESAGLHFLYVSEPGEGDLNGDTDSTDNFVLGMIDTFSSAPEVTMVGFAVSSAVAPLQATRTGGDYLVTFLADEQGQNVNYNTITLLGAAWQPPQCSALDDGDMDDEVLHWLRYNAFVTDPVGNAPTNTGLVGSQFVYQLGNAWVGTLSLESDEGSSSGCDLNSDGDSSDLIFRWVRALPSELPPTNPAKLHAVAPLPGGSGGIAVLEDTLWCIVVDENADGRDHDGDTSADRDLIAVHDPQLPGTNFNFDHGGGQFVEASWVSSDPGNANRILLALTENSDGSDRNGDGDALDSVPTFPIQGNPRELDFPGVGVAVSENNSGLVSASGFGFYRIREASQSFDFNGDGDTGDLVLQRVRLDGSQAPTYMGLLQDNFGPAVIVEPGGSSQSMAWLALESQQGSSGFDLNGDGDGNDFVLRYTRLP